MNQALPASLEPNQAFERHRAAIRARLVSAGANRARPDSITWTINSEILVVAGWGRAILLQLAHPLVAAGVNQHSTFRGSLLTSFRRLGSTISAMLSLTFGDEDAMTAAAAGINRIHDRVSGRLEGGPAGAFPSGERYSAHDPELLRWVHATLLDSIPQSYELLVRPLTLQERDRYCAEAAIMEPLLGIPPGLLPRTSAELDAYMQEMIGSGRIAVTAESRALADAILSPPGWWLLWPAFRPMQLMTIGLLPTAIREAYGFRWGPREARSLQRWIRLLRVVRRGLPRVAREWPSARRGIRGG